MFRTLIKESLNSIYTNVITQIYHKIQIYTSKILSDGWYRLGFVRQSKRALNVRFTKYMQVPCINLSERFMHSVIACWCVWLYESCDFLDLFEYSFRRRFRKCRQLSRITLELLITMDKLQYLIQMVNLPNRHNFIAI